MPMVLMLHKQLLSIGVRQHCIREYDHGNLKFSLNVTLRIGLAKTAELKCGR